MKVPFWGSSGEFCPTMEIVLIFLEFVKGEGAKNQLVVGDKMVGITDSISPNNLLIQTEKINWL